MSTKPEAGQWWFPNCVKQGWSANDAGVFIIGRNSDDDLVYQYNKRGCVGTEASELNNWHHEPRCTGWDWVVPEPEPQPAEDPDEWVIQDRVPPRANIDVVSWSHWKKGEEVAAQCTWEHPQVHGFTDCLGHRLSVRCRRRDLPKVEQCIESFDCANGDHSDACPMATRKKPEPQPQKTRVKLWMRCGSGQFGSAVVASTFEKTGDWQEIHHDSEGFYVEGDQS